MGPLLPLIMAAAPAISKIFGGAAKGSADQRYGETNQNLAVTNANNANALNRASLMNQNATTRAGMENAYNQFNAGLDMERKKYLQAEPGMQARQALIGNLLEKIQPLQLSGLSERVQQSMPKMNSIIDSLGPEARQAGQLLAQRGLSGLQSGPTQFDPMPKVSLPDVLNLPPAQLAAMQKSGLLEKIMGGIGLGASVVGALGDLKSVSGGGEPSQFANGMPSPYTGMDRYGNAGTFQLPRPELNPNLNADYFGYGGG